MSNVRETFKERFGENKAEKRKKKLFGDSSNSFLHLGVDENVKKIHAEANIPRPLMIDEVAFAFVAGLRVSAWETLGEEFAGYKQGRLWAYILSVLNEHIEESTAATIRVDVPLYEQCPIVNSGDFRVATTEELLEKTEEILNIISEKLKKETSKGDLNADK